MFIEFKIQKAIDTCTYRHVFVWFSIFTANYRVVRKLYRGCGWYHSKADIWIYRKKDVWCMERLYLALNKVLLNAIQCSIHTLKMEYENSNFCTVCSWNFRKIFLPVDSWVSKLPARMVHKKILFWSNQIGLSLRPDFNSHVTSWFSTTNDL